MIHQEIQPENIIWNAKTGQVAIIDFASTKKHTHPQKKSGIKSISSGNLFLHRTGTNRTNQPTH